MSKKNKERKKTTSCGAVTWRMIDGKVEILLIKQFANKDRWGIPKGHLDEGETLEQCAVREVREETGVQVQLGFRLPDCHIQNKVEDKTVVSWLATPVGSHELRHNDPDNEVADARWFEVTQLPEIMVYQRSLVAAAVKAVFAVMENGNVPRPT